jgi:hypothetical protein
MPALRPIALVLASCAVACAEPDQLDVDIPPVATGGVWREELPLRDLERGDVHVDDSGIVEVAEVRARNGLIELSLRGVREGKTEVTIDRLDVHARFDVAVFDPVDVEPSYRGWLGFIGQSEVAAPVGAQLLFTKPWLSNGDDVLLGDGGYRMRATDGLSIVDERADGSVLVQVDGAGELVVDTAGADRTIAVAIADLERVDAVSLLHEDGAEWACVEATAPSQTIYGAAAGWVVDGTALGTGTCLRTPPSGQEGAREVDVQVTLGASTLSARVVVDPGALTLE